MELTLLAKQARFVG